MEFLYPTFLYGLAALAIPIIIHLFHFRRFKKVYFTNVRYLREIKEESSSRSKLRNLLVLLLRLLALAFLVFAFAQPFIPNKNQKYTQGKQAVSIYLDNSYSMEALSEDVPLLDKAKRRAREIVNALAADTEIQILSNDFEGRHQRLFNKEDALALIEEVHISPIVKDLERVQERQIQALNFAKAERKKLYQISDFQKNTTKFTAAKDTNTLVSLIPLQAVQIKNTAIDSAWFEAPVQMLNQNNQLIVKVHNYGLEEAENVNLSIEFEGQKMPIGVHSIEAGGFITDTVSLKIRKTGWHEAKLNIIDYPIQFDDDYYFSFNVPDIIEVLSINQQENNYLNQAFGGMPNFTLTNQSFQKVDYSDLSKYKLIILDQLPDISSGLSFALKEFLTRGGNILFFPNINSSSNTYSSFLSNIGADPIGSYQPTEMEVNSINTDEYIFNDVFLRKNSNIKLPKAQGYFPISVSPSKAGEPLMRFRNGQVALMKYRIENGHFYSMSIPVDVEKSDLVKSGEIFIPMLYKMALSSAQIKPIAYTLGKDDYIQSKHSISENDIVYKIKMADKEFIPEQRINTGLVTIHIGENFTQSGFATLYLGDENEIADRYAFNFDRRESDMQFYTEDELKEMVPTGVDILDIGDDTSLTQLIEEQSIGKQLWKIALIMALGFLLAEVVILRLWKV